jgi:hypothetical protein
MDLLVMGDYLFEKNKQQMLKSEINWKETFKPD